MNTALKIPRLAKSEEPVDCPGWIPPEITYAWDTNPYAYQTEEELMPITQKCNHTKVLSVTALHHF